MIWCAAFHYLFESVEWTKTVKAASSFIFISSIFLLCFDSVSEKIEWEDLLSGKVSSSCFAWLWYRLTQNTTQQNNLSQSSLITAPHLNQWHEKRKRERERVGFRWIWTDWTCTSVIFFSYNIWCFHFIFPFLFLWKQTLKCPV